MKKAPTPSSRKAFNQNAPDLGPTNLTAAELARALNPPHDDTADVLHGVTVHDPFRPLETLDAKATRDWMARENKKAQDFLAPSQDVEAATIAFFESATPSGKRESMPEKYGDKYFVWRKDEGQTRFTLYVKDTPDFNDEGRLLLDPNKIDPSGKTAIPDNNMDGIPDVDITHDGKIVAYPLSVSGSDQNTLRFIDVATGEDLDLVYTKFRSPVDWDRDGQGFHYMQSNEKTKSSSVRYHKMGTPVKDDVIVYDPKKPETESWYSRLKKDSSDTPGDYEWINISKTDPVKAGLLIRRADSNEAFKEFYPYGKGTPNPIAEINGKIYATTDRDAPNNKLVCIDPNDPSPEKWQTLLPEDKNDPLKSAFVWQNKIFATYGHDTGEVLKVFDLSGKYLHDAPVPPLSTFALGNVNADDPKALITYDNFQQPGNVGSVLSLGTGNVYEYDSDTNEMTLQRKSSIPIDLKDCIVERIQATSKDGTKVPMTVIRSPDTKLDGTAATLLYGYGGFDVSLDPVFSVAAAQWVRAGGIYVQANLRGGGEFGKEWYDDGRKKNKQHVFDDFAASAEKLIADGYTSSKRLAIHGGSNGGLLTLATMVQHPELFGAVVSEVPVADMFRFHIGSYYGYSWKSDYGDPDVKRDFTVSAKYSPLHNVPEGFKHPPLLIKTDVNDVRVLPWHSFKMAATLQAEESPDSLTLLQVRTDGGHGAGMTEKQRWYDTAVVRAFLTETLGPINQDDYKASLKKAPQKKATASKKHKPKDPKGPKTA